METYHTSRQLGPPLYISYSIDEREHLWMYLCVLLPIFFLTTPIRINANKASVMKNAVTYIIKYPFPFLKQVWEHENRVKKERCPLLQLKFLHSVWVKGGIPWTVTVRAASANIHFLVNLYRSYLSYKSSFASFILSCWFLTHYTVPFSWSSLSSLPLEKNSYCSLNSFPCTLF